MCPISERAYEITRLLDLSAEYFDPNPGRSHINGQVHALRVATLMYNFGTTISQDAAEFLGFAGLIHDLGRPLNDIYHGELIAEAVRDRVPLYIYHILRTHGYYQEALVHNTEFPQQSEEIVAKCLPYDIQGLSIIFAGFEAFSFDPDYFYSSEEWTYNLALDLIRVILH